MKKEQNTIGLSSDFIIHPGETLAEVLKDRKMSQKELAIRTGMTEKYISTIINGQENISSSFANKLEYALDIEKEFWMNLQANYEREKRMYERISDIGNRQILVNKLKNKINKEIKIQRKNHNELYKYNDDKDYVVNQIIKEEFAMIKLKEYLDYEYSFMDYSIKYYDKDVVIYYIDIDLINIWLQDTFNFVNNYLDKVDEHNYNDILFILNDKYLGNEFTSIFDTALYKENNKDIKISININ